MILLFVDSVFSWIIKSTKDRVDGGGGVIISFLFVE